MPLASSRLEKIILDTKLVTPDQLIEAKAAENGKSLLRVLDELGFASENEVASTLAKTLKLDLVDLNTFDIDPNVAILVDDGFAIRHRLIPIAREDNNLIVAMTDPANVIAIDDLQIITGSIVRPVVSTETEIRNAIGRFCHQGANVQEMVESVADDIDDLRDKTDETETSEEESEAPVVKLVNLILTEAVRNRANDVHIEPCDTDVRIRFRIDGVLHEMMRSPKKVQAGLVSRIKIIAGMDIAERRVPQDGRFGLMVGGVACDFRVATLPTIFGEKVVLRLLSKEAVMMDLNDLGFSNECLERFKQSFTKPYGAILVTGPTGSGKTTTLYAGINILNEPEKNIITVEDPVEYRLEGLNQVQVNLKAELTFSAALRSILRHDPDIVMIGEIRDEETALIAIESALTGHLVLSTLHTNDAPSSLTRLVEMGIEPFLVSSAVDCVVAQRLARKLCVSCKEPYKPTKKALDDIKFPVGVSKIDKIYRAKGCKKCNSTGYRGRIGLYEVLVVSENIERLVAKKVTSDELGKVAQEEGMKTLRHDGFLKVLSGDTSIEEIMRVTT
ncbi:MAG: Flp pilus assembly complex ATPase component TadA [Actinomycetia bacterium]|nr:Flp pilus assembly complex ATPase component TadA [Actinomycetes bacterium]